MSQADANSVAGESIRAGQTGTGCYKNHDHHFGKIKAKDGQIQPLQPPDVQGLLPPHQHHHHHHHHGEEDHDEEKQIHSPEYHNPVSFLYLFLGFFPNNNPGGNRYILMLFHNFFLQIN